jgi:predicted XRE-type DNA-binding protein
MGKVKQQMSQDCPSLKDKEKAIELLNILKNLNKQQKTELLNLKKNQQLIATVFGVSKSRIHRLSVNKENIACIDSVFSDFK